MLFGAHISLKDGFEGLPDRAKRVECEVFQMFSRSPRGGPVKPIDPKIATDFKARCAALNFPRWYIHAPYVMNLASPVKRTHDYSFGLILEELNRADILGTTAVVTHLGSAGTEPKATGIKQVATALKAVLEKYSGPVKLLLEISAGAGSLVGDSVADFKAINTLTGHTWGLCLDTAHLCGSGYDLTTTSMVQKVLDEWDREVGLSNVGLLHLNDSAVPLGSRKDRHTHLGKGHIGLEGFRAIVAEPRLKDCDAVVETPKDDEFKDDLMAMRLLKTLRGRESC